MANRHEGAPRTHVAVMLRSASQISFVAASSVGKCPRVLMIFRTRALTLSSERISSPWTNGDIGGLWWSPPLPLVIFTTAYDEFAVKAFEFNALDYLLKPVDPNRLVAALEKLRLHSVAGDATVDHRTRLTADDKVFVREGERCWFVPVKNIRLLESEGNYTRVHFDDQKPQLFRSLTAMEERLDSKQFFRANRKHIINLRWIEKIEPYFNGGLLVELKGGEKIEVSRRQTVKFKEMMSF